MSFSSCVRTSSSSSSVATQASGAVASVVVVRVIAMPTLVSLFCLAGQIKADGGDQQKFDDGMRQLRKAGIQVGRAYVCPVWNSPVKQSFNRSRCGHPQNCVCLCFFLDQPQYVKVAREAAARPKKSSKSQEVNVGS